MNSVIPVERLHGVGVVVDNLDRATRRYAEVFGIDQWEVRTYDANRLTHASSYGRATAPVWRTATGSTTPPGADDLPVTVELIEHVSGENPWHEFACTRKQGIAHLTLAVQSVDAFERLRPQLEDAGLPIVAAYEVDGRLRRYFIDVRQPLGGFLVEIRVPVGDDVAIAVDEVWDHAGTYSRPEGVGPYEVQRVHHFGIVIDNLMTTLPEYNRLLGVPDFMIRNWRSAPGSLENAYYRDQPVDHAYFTGLGQCADFGVEIIQPTFGPQHYQDEFRGIWGPGVHHMLLSITYDAEAFTRNQEWLASIGMPLAMGADIGSGCFCYHDTVEDLGGFILEGVRRGSDPTKRPQPAWTIDFSAIAARL